MLLVRPNQPNRRPGNLLWLGAAILFGASLAVMLLAALGGGPAAYGAPMASPNPTVASVTPGEAYNDVATVITITGVGFAATPALYLNNAWLEDVGFIDSATLTATVPADLPGGVYTITVTNPDGGSRSLANAFTVDLSGDGSLGAWLTTSTLNASRYSAAAVQAGNWLYVLGGLDSGTSVERATINSDGILSAWQVLTSALNLPRQFFGAVRVGRSIYAVGGEWPGSGLDHSNTVERASIQSDGTLSAWQILTATLNLGRAALGVTATNRFVYAVGGLGRNYYTATGTVERAPIQPDGTLGPWEVLTATLNTARDQLAVVQIAGYLFVIGGYNDQIPGELASVEEAAINPNGTLATWQTLATSLPTWRSAPAVIAANGCMYVIGGLVQGSGATVVVSSRSVRACVSGSGVASDWELLTPTLNVGRSAAAIAYADSRIFVIGGYNANLDQTPLSNVEELAINPPSLFSFAPSLASTSQPTTVTVWGNNLLRPATLQLPDNTILPTTPDTPWDLTAAIPSGLPPGWYTATVTLQNGLTATQPNLFKVQAPPPALTDTVYLPLAASYGPRVCGNYFDGFGSPSSGWSVGNDGYVLSDYLNGEYWVLSEQPGYFYYFYPPTCLRQNYVVEADARWVAESGDDYGLIFGRNTNGQYYLFRVSPRYGDYNLLRRDSGQWVTLQAWTVNSAVLSGGATNHLKVTRNGTQIKLELNGVTLGTWTDGTTSGPTSVGLYSTTYADGLYSDARFDNFRITALPGASAFPAGVQSQVSVAGGVPALVRQPDRDPAPSRDQP